LYIDSKVVAELLTVNVIGVLSTNQPIITATTKTKQFWGMNSRFQAKLAKSNNMHIRLLHRFQPNFAQ